LIPKIIHYCWFGGNPLPDTALKCIASWKKYCPDYEIKQWDESNFDVNACAYTREAYKAKKWAFVSDYARFKILYDEGGLYFDTDVEIIKPMDDIIERGPFMGCEPSVKRNKIAAGLGLAANAGLGLAANAGLGLAANAGLPESKLYRSILHYYEKQHFLMSNGSINTETVVTRVTNILEKHGFKGDGSIEHICGTYIYPSEYFCPMDGLTGELKITKNTHSIHHYDGSWYSKRERLANEYKRKLIKIFPRKTAGHIAGFLAYLKCDGVHGTLKHIINRLGK
jgi:hypothetical protein